MASRKKSKNQWKEINEFFIKYQVIFFLLIALTAYTILRLHAASLPITDQWAQQTLEANYRTTGRQNLIGTAQFGEEVEKLSENYKNIYRDKDGKTYLLGVDSYKYLGEARDILGGGKADSFLPYLEVYFYKFLKFFNSKATLIQAAFWLPFVVTFFSIILIFFIAGKLTNNLGGFFAAFLLSIHPQFFTATQAGFTDTNFLNLFFTLLIVFLFFKGIDFKGKIKDNVKPIVFLALIIPVSFLFWFTWVGFFYILVVISFFIVLYIAYFLILKNRESSSKKYKIIFFIFILFILVSIFFLKDNYLVKFGIKKVSERTGGYERGVSFPSSTSTTTELLSAPEAQKIKKSSQGSFLYLLNGWILAILTIISITFLIKNQYKLNKKSKYAFFAVIWFIMMFVAGYKSIRFISFFGLPFCVVASYGLVEIFNFSEKKLTKKYRYKKSIVKPTIVIIILLIILLPLLETLSERTYRTPLMKNTIEKISNQLKESDENAIINLWWDKGYFYSYYTERKVSMDNGVGGSSDPRLYWTARAFMSKNEKEAIQIFKMINCELPYFYFTNLFLDLSAINCTPPEAYILLDNGLIGRVDIFQYYANWDFEIKTHNPFSYPEIPSISSPANCFPNNDKSHLICGQNFDIDMGAGKLVYKATESPTELPFVIVGDGNIFYSEKKGPYSVLVYPVTYEGGWIYRSVLIKSELLDTLFVKLYFMKGIGLGHFEPFSEIADRTAGRVVVYKIKWDA